MQQDTQVVVAIDFKRFLKKKAKRGRPRTGDVENITRDLNRHYKEMINLMPKDPQKWAKLPTTQLFSSYYLLLRLALSEKNIYKRVNWTSNPQAAKLAEYVKPIVLKRLQTVAGAVLKAATFSVFSKLFKNIASSGMDKEKLDKFVDAVSLMYAVDLGGAQQFIDNNGIRAARAIAQKWSTVVKSKKTRILIKLLKKYGLDVDALGNNIKHLAVLTKLGKLYKKIMQTERVGGAMATLDNIMKFTAAGGLEGIFKIISGLSSSATALYVFKRRPTAKKLIKYVPPSLKRWLGAATSFINSLLQADARFAKSKPRYLKTKKFKIKQWSRPDKFIDETSKKEAKPLIDLNQLDAGEF